MGKKGIFGSLLVDPWFIIAFIFLLIIFYFLFTLTVSKTSMEITGKFVDLGDSLTLMNFLKVPVDKMTVLDLFYFYARDKKEETARKIIENADFFNDAYCIELDFDGKRIEGNFFNYCSTITGKESDSITLTSFDGKQIKWKLFRKRANIKEPCETLYRKEICENWLGCKWDNGCKRI